MAKKQYFLIIDTETTIGDKVADFGALVVDRKGNIFAECAVLVREFYLDKENFPLFHDQSVDPLWGARNLPRRYAEYDAMLTDGRRQLASVAAINRWLSKVNLKYRPTATAYNKAFDWGKMRNSGIDADQFEKTFCLWHATADHYIKSRNFRSFILERHLFNSPTAKGNMTFQTNAEVMARFITGDWDMPNEPHTAFEDAKYYELPILLDILKKNRNYLNPNPYSWHGVQVRDWFIAK
jgi:hypothetical protein